MHCGLNDPLIERSESSWREKYNTFISCCVILYCLSMAMAAWSDDAPLVITPRTLPRRSVTSLISGLAYRENA